MIRYLFLLFSILATSWLPHIGKAAIGIPADTVFITLSPQDYVIEANGALPQYHTQFDMGENCEAAEGVDLFYPEFAPMTAAEIASVRHSGISLSDSIVIHIEQGVSRRHLLLDVSVTPFVCRNGRWMRLTSCRLVPRTKKPSAIQDKSTALRATTGERWIKRSVLAEGRWVKIHVSTEGIYALTPEFLRRAGFTDPSKVRLYGQGGRILDEAWTFTGYYCAADDLEEIPLRRRSDGTALFFAEGTIRTTRNAQTGNYYHENNPYSRFSYYFLTEDNSPAEMTECRASGTTDKNIDRIKHLAIVDVDVESLYAGGRNLYDDFNFSTATIRTLKLPTPGIIEGETSTVDIAVAATSANTAYPFELQLENISLTKFSIPRYGNDQSGYETRVSVTTNLLKASNTFRLIAGATGIDARLNYLRINYQRKLNATETPYAFSPAVAGRVTLSIEGSTADTELWQIGRAGVSSKRWAGKLDGTTLKVTIDDGMERYVVVNPTATYPTPTDDGEVRNQNLHADTAVDMIIIVPPSGALTAEAERLAEAHRQHSGLRVRVVNAGHIYNEYSSGTPDASALRRYMKMLYDRAINEADIPRYLLLFGPCAWDNRMLTSDWKGYSTDNYLPAFEVSGNATASTISGNYAFGVLDCYVTDDIYGWLDDSEGTDYKRNKLDIAIGRFPCDNTETAHIMVDKTISYLRGEVKGAWKNKIYMLGDDINNTLHMKGAEAAAKKINEATNGAYQVGKVYWDAQLRTNTATGYTYPQTTRRLRDIMGRGALMFNYTGHGSPEQISHARVLLKEDFKLPAEGRLPLWVMASCEISPFDTQREDIGRIALNNPTGGAVAVMCASRSVYSNYNEVLNGYFCQFLFATDNKGRLLTMGEALRRTKVNLITSGGDATINKLKYVLLGDPAVALAAPRRRMVVDSLNGQKATSDQPFRLKAGSIARISGYVTDDAGGTDISFNGSVTGSLFDRMETITCKNNSRDEETMIYEDRTKMVFEGSDSIRAGRFSLLIPIPRDISYSDQTGRLNLYAAATSGQEAHGFFENFCLNGTDDNAPIDTINPEVFVYLNTPDFPDGGIVSSGAMFLADIKDDCGINASGISIGHDIELYIDNHTADIITLNDYFTYDFGSYRSGHVAFPLPPLEPGAHELAFRVWDVNNNATTRRLRFHIGTVSEAEYAVIATHNPARTQTNFVVRRPLSETPQRIRLDVYDIVGRRVWTHTSGEVTGSSYLYTWPLNDMSGARLPSGMYLYRATILSANNEYETNTERIILLHP